MGAYSTTMNTNFNGFDKTIKVFIPNKHSTNLYCHIKNLN